MKRSVLALTLATALLAASPASSASFPSSEELLASDDALLHGTITPPGTPLLEKQKELRAYDDLVQGYPALTQDEITTKYFKDGSFDVPTDVSREYFPRADVKVLRDTEWGVPHVYGEDDLAAAFGAGYVAIEDRLPIIMLLIALGRAEAFELLGDNASWLADAEIARIYGYTEAEFQSMIDRIPAEYGQDGQDLLDGFYGQVWTDLSMVLGEELRSPTSQAFCGSDVAGGDGSLAACAERLWASLAAVADAAPNDGSGERIQFLPTAALSMHWVNRPTTQHIAMFGRLGGAVQVPPAVDRPVRGPLPATGPAPWVGLGVLALLLAVALTRRRQVW